MKLIPYNWRFRNLVSLIHFVVGAGCGLAVKATTPLPSVMGWTLVMSITAILFVLFNYRIEFGNGDNRRHERKTRDAPAP